MSAGTLLVMQEFMSLKVASTDHADLATQLTTMSTQGWMVVNIVSTGADLIAYMSRPKERSVAAATSSAVASSDVVGSGDSSAGWASSSTVTTPLTQTDKPSIPADWYKDPSGRFEYRYWDGSKWTDNVSRAGVAYKDPPVP